MTERVRPNQSLEPTPKVLIRSLPALLPPPLGFVIYVVAPALNPFASRPAGRCTGKVED